FDRASQRFNSRQGPVFTQLLLADEVNRASPRTQSALLEAMEERQVSADGTTYPLPEPFFVVATQNPHEQLGTFALPESQLDRFLMRVTLGYPDSAHERELLRGGERRELLSHVAPALSAAAATRSRARSSAPCQCRLRRARCAGTPSPRCWRWRARARRPGCAVARERICCRSLSSGAASTSFRPGRVWRSRRCCSSC